MGFSVSGSVVVVLLGLFVALGTFYTTGADTVERLTAAQGDRGERFDRVRESDINITSVSLLSGVTCGVEVRANNTGSTTLSLNDTTLLLNNTIITDWRDGAEVDGDASTDLWAPGEQLVVTRDDLLSAPDSVTLVAKTGVSTRSTTGGLLC